MRYQFEAETNCKVLRAYLDAFVVFWDQIIEMSEDEAIFEAYELIRIIANKKWPDFLSERSNEVFNKVRTDFEQD